MTTTPAEASMAVTPSRFGWTVHQFYQALAAGGFTNPERLELIGGEIIENMPLSPLHADTAEYFATCLRAVLPPHLRVREEKPIHIAFDGEPTPDITIVSAQRAWFGPQHPVPNEVMLLVEIAISSVEYDLGSKALLYAQAGISDYWVVLPEAGAIVVHREPTTEGYLSVVRLGLDDTLAPLAASEAVLAVRDLLGQQKEL